MRSCYVDGVNLKSVLPIYPGPEEWGWGVRIIITNSDACCRDHGAALPYFTRLVSH
jgi:hypothetical protein